MTLLSFPPNPPRFLVANIRATHYTIMFLREVFQQLIQRPSWDRKTKEFL